MDISLLGIAIVSFVLGVVLIAYDQKLRELRKLRNDKKQIEEKARQRAIQIVEEARDKALAIVEQARVNAGDNQKEIDAQLARVSEQQIDVYRHILQDVSREIEKDAQKEVEDFRKALEMETLGAQRAVTSRIEKEYVEAQKRLEEYQQDRKRQVDEKAAEVLQEFTKIVFKKALPFEEQKELVIQALEEAKRQHGF